MTKLTPLELAAAVASEAASQTFDSKQVRVATLPPPAFVFAPTQPMPSKPVSVLPTKLVAAEEPIAEPIAESTESGAEGSWDLPVAEPLECATLLARTVPTVEAAGREDHPPRCAHGDGRDPCSPHA